MNRRQVLAALGTTALTSVTGCATLEAELGMRADTLGAVTLANGVGETREVSLEVLRDGTLVHRESYQLAPGSERERPQYTVNEWQENPDARRWTVRAKIPGSEWRDATIDAARGSEGECYSAAVVAGDWPETPLLVLLGGCESENR
ncbi:MULTISPECIES: hypothetical protein [Halorussus]|uniref:hypothetical protein n=1 Tax=Halorussus TaxID=1070314 RepID=UPI0013B46789|nr:MULTISPECIES: hypothetical protein [Halorussus]NHN57993.1 hypothetical protein [Halorussus sp. JP-T4]